MTANRKSPPAPPSRADIARWLALAHTLADATGPAVLKHFRKSIAVENKDADKGVGAFDPVTAADVGAEKVMRKLLAAAEPTHGIAGEELEDTAGAGRFIWVLDPIDGTRAFITGVPLWGTLIGLMDGDTPLIGLMDQPFTAERFFSSGTGAFATRGNAKPKRLLASDTTDVSAAKLMCTSPDMFQTRAEKAGFARLESAVKLRRFGGDCYAYAMLAAGHVDLVVEANLKAVDIVALIPIIEQAGGVVTTWDGAPAVQGGQIIAAATPELHRNASALLTK